MPHLKKKRKNFVVSTDGAHRHFEERADVKNDDNNGKKTQKNQIYSLIRNEMTIVVVFYSKPFGMSDGWMLAETVCRCMFTSDSSNIIF